jgi:hypothetical protein
MVAKGVALAEEVRASKESSGGNAAGALFGRVR